jgi:hypothetical protein
LVVAALLTGTGELEQLINGEGVVLLDNGSTATAHHAQNDRFWQQQDLTLNPAHRPEIALSHWPCCGLCA